MGRRRLQNGSGLVGVEIFWNWHGWLSACVVGWHRQRHFSRLNKYKTMVKFLSSLTQSWSPPECLVSKVSWHSRVEFFFFQHLWNTNMHIYLKPALTTVNTVFKSCMKVAKQIRECPQPAHQHSSWRFFPDENLAKVWETTACAWIMQIFARQVEPVFVNFSFDKWNMLAISWLTPTNMSLVTQAPGQSPTPKTHPRLAYRAQ